MSWTSITTTLQCWKGMCWKNWCHDDLIGKNLAAFARTHPVPAGVSEEASQTNYSRSNHYFWRWSTNSRGWVSGGLSVTFEWEVRPFKPVLHYYVIKLQSLNHFQCHSLIQYSQKNTLSHTVPPSPLLRVPYIRWIMPMCVSVCRHWRVCQSACVWACQK